MLVCLFLQIYAAVLDVYAAAGIEHLAALKVVGGAGDGGGGGEAEQQGC